MANSNLSLEGTALLNDPVYNRGTAFTEEERSAHQLEGLLPAAVDDLPTQLKCVLGHLSAKPTALEQFIYLQDLCDRNETLFLLIEKIVRVPVKVFGDLRAQLAACHIAEAALIDLAAHYGTEKLAQYMTELVDYAERMTRATSTSHG